MGDTHVTSEDEEAETVLQLRRVRSGFSRTINLVSTPRGYSRRTPVSVECVRMTNHIFGNSYWFMHFDASPKTLRGLHTLLRKDPRVIRWTMLKEGEKVEDVVELKEQTIDHSSAFDSVTSVSTTSPVSLRSHQNPRSPSLSNVRTD